MTKPALLNLTINADKLNIFCDKLLKRSRDISKTHDALSTLEAFITTFSSTANHPDATQRIETILHSFSERTRQQLLAEQTTALNIALNNLDVTTLADIHSHLSRNGFYQIMTNASAQWSSDTLTTIKTWSHNWVNDAKLKAEQASGYPEAYDFNQAGIDIKAFQAMKDVSHFLQSSD